MDPDTENHLAALIMEEASRLRLQAEKDGVHVYLAKPKARGRPNSQFLQATVRNVEQDGISSAQQIVQLRSMTCGGVGLWS